MRQASSSCTRLNHLKLTTRNGSKDRQLIAVVQNAVIGHVFLIYGEQKLVSAQLWKSIQNLVEGEPNRLIRVEGELSRTISDFVGRRTKEQDTNLHIKRGHAKSLSYLIAP